MSWGIVIGASLLLFLGSESESRSVVSDSLQLHKVHGILQGRILEWVDIPFSRRSFQPKDWTLVSHTVGRFFTSWARQGSPSVQFSSLQLLSPVRLFATPWIAARQASPTIIISQSSLRLSPLSQWCHPAISSSVVPFSSCPQSLTASESFPMSQLFAWGGQSTGGSALASFLPKKFQGWSPSEWTVWISLQSKGLSGVFSNTTVQKHQFFGAQLSSQSNFHIHPWPLEKP